VTRPDDWPANERLSSLPMPVRIAVPVRRRGYDKSLGSTETSAAPEPSPLSFPVRESESVPLPVADTIWYGLGSKDRCVDPAHDTQPGPCLRQAGRLVSLSSALVNPRHPAAGLSEEGWCATRRCCERLRALSSTALSRQRCGLVLPWRSGAHGRTRDP
jgi:hypothetical protein